MLPEILPTHTPALFAEAVNRAADLLERGEVVAVPTETVYGLAANALNPSAVQRIFTVKGRPGHNPIIVHVEGLEMAAQCVTQWTEAADRAARAFWPGPLTIVLPRANGIPSIVTAGGATVGVRWPSHPFVQALIRMCGFPLAAPSANLSNRVSPTSARHVAKQLGERIPLIIDGGQAQVGIESTVLDLSADPPRVLRPGMIHEEALLAVLGRLASSSVSGSPVLKSPGQLPKHYSPQAKLVVWEWESERELQDRIATAGVAVAGIHLIVHSRVPPGNVAGRISVIPHDPEAFARALYAELHACDEAGAQLIAVEMPPSGPEWNAIRDRLRRAAA